MKPFVIVYGFLLFFVTAIYFSGTIQSGWQNMTLLIFSMGLVMFALSDLILNWLKPNGKVLLEIGFDQFESVKTLFESKGFLFNQVLVDMQGIKRTLEFNR